MNVFVCIFGQQVAMCSPRSANIGFGHVANAAERLGVPIGQIENDDEVVDAIELTFELLTVLKSNRCRNRSLVPSAAAASTDPIILQIPGIREPGSDSFQISSVGVACTALRGEIGFA